MLQTTTGLRPIVSDHKRSADKTMRIRLFLALAFGTVTATELPPEVFNPNPKYGGPHTYKDPESKITFYVESDGRHVAAISEEGKMLWVRDPFVDAKLKPYRHPRPFIVKIERPSENDIGSIEGHFVMVSFSSSQFGILDIQNGKFIWLGQD